MSEQNVLHIILEKFPERASALDKLFREDENFREICADYALCLRSMGKIIITNESMNTILVEYKNVLNELEIEMLAYLNTKSTL